MAFGKAESSREVLGHIGQGDLALIVACHVAHGALTSGKLIGTENDDGVDVVLVGELELALERATLAVGFNDKAGVAQLLHEAEGLKGHLGAGLGYEDIRVDELGHGGVGGLHGEHDALKAGSEAQAGGGLAARDLDELVVTAAATDGVLRAETVGHLDLEDGARVVVQTAHQARVLDIGDVLGVEVALDGLVVGAAVGAQGIGDLGGALHHLVAVVVLAIEGAQRVRVGTTTALLAQFLGMLADVGGHGIAVGRAAGVVAHRVDEDAHLALLDAQGLDEAHEHDDELGVGGRVGSAQALHANLVELAQTALLGTLGAEHGAGIPQLCGGGTLRHEVVLDEGAHRAGRALRTKGEALVSLELVGPALAHLGVTVGRQDGEHLLADDVGGGAQTVDEDIGLLKGGNLDGDVAVCSECLLGSLTHIAPHDGVVADEILSALWLVSCHALLLG